MKIAYNRRRLAIDMKDIHPHPFFTCDVCGEILKSRMAKYWHKKENINHDSFTRLLKEKKNVPKRTHEDDKLAGRKNKNESVKRKVSSVGSKQIITCKLCLGQYNARTNLKTHIEDVHKGRKFMCDTCGVVIKGESNHYKHRHQEFKCRATTFTVYYDDAITPTRFFSQKNLKCEICDQRFENPNAKRHHFYQVHHGRRFRCNVCSQIITSHRHLHVHNHRKHGGEAKFTAFYERSGRENCPGGLDVEDGGDGWNEGKVTGVISGCDKNPSASQSSSSASQSSPSAAQFSSSASQLSSSAPESLLSASQSSSPLEVGEASILQVRTYSEMALTSGHRR